MNLGQYLGRVLLAIGVIAVAIWATVNKLLDMPVHTFWTGILCYLLAAEVLWTLAERWAGNRTRALPRRGVVRLARRERLSLVTPRWFQEGGRPRMSDLLAHHDSPREALKLVQPAILARVTAPRLHLLTAPVGSGRSTLLLRLARTLLEADQTVFLVLPSPELPMLEDVLDVARRRQVYVLVDDLDLRPEAEDWLYEFIRSGLPIVVVATSTPPPLADARAAGLDALRPVALLDQAVRHDVSVTHVDLVGLARKLSAQGDLQRAGLALGETDDLLAASRACRGREGRTGLWRDLGRSDNLPTPGKLMIALLGCAEMALSARLWQTLFGQANLPRWQRAGLVAEDHGLVLPPHRLTCLEYLEQVGLDSAATAEALETLRREGLLAEPAFVARLLCALARQPRTRELARRCLAPMQGTPPPADWPDVARRAWQRALATLDLQPTDTAPSEYPPEVSLAVATAYRRRDWPRVLELARQLSASPVYRGLAHFATALALAHQGEALAAERELDNIQGGPAGVHYLRGVLAEMQGDVLRALDAYEVSRKSDELQVSSTRSLAFAYVKCGAPRSAIPLFEALLAYDPLDADLYAGLAVAHLHAGMAQRAAAQSARAIQAGVDPIAARKAVARACAKVHAYGRAAPELEACVSYDDKDMEAWGELAAACHWLGRFSREEECLRRLQGHDPSNDEFRLQMARCQRDLGRSEQALDLLRPLLTAPEPTQEVLLLAAEVAGEGEDRQLQERLARQAVQQGDETGWGHFWLADSYGEASDQANASYRVAVQQMQQQIEAGAPPRHTATLWQAICIAAASLGDETLATQAGRKASQEAAICEALGAEIHSIAHRQAVPPDLFLESLPFNGSLAPRPREVVADVPEKGLMAPITAPTESSTLRNRRLRWS